MIGFRYFHPLTYQERKHKKWQLNTIKKPYADLFQYPLLHTQTTISDVEFLVMDFETSGLNSDNDHILSIGWVVIKNTQIHLDSAVKLDVFAPEHINPETAVIHHIMPEMLSDALPAQTAIELLLKDMKGKVLIAHAVGIERGFLQRYCQRLFGLDKVPLLWLDTLRIERSLMINSAKNPQYDFQLSSIRRDYGLPDYPAHDALIDAVATAEVFLAQTKQLCGKTTPTLGILYERSLYPYSEHRY